MLLLGLRDGVGDELVYFCKIPHHGHAGQEGSESPFVIASALTSNTITSPMNERELINMIASTALQQTPPELIQGIGDDCAVLRRPGALVWLFTMDTLVEGVHFDRAFHPPELLGRKTLAVNLSDIAAMGGRSRFCLFSAGLPPGFDAAWFTAFMRGMQAACEQYEVVLIGGDTVAHPGGYSFSVTLMGEMEEGLVRYRHGAKPGDGIWVSGPLGFAAAGLAILSQGLKLDDLDSSHFVAKHLNPQPRVVLGPALAEHALAQAMMDMSDGLTTDLAHLCTASGVGARLFAERLPGPALLRNLAALCGVDPWDWVLRGGEDYELLFTARAEDSDRLHQLGADCGCELFCIGIVEQEIGLRLVQGKELNFREEPLLPYQGFDHFPRPAAETF